MRLVYTMWSMRTLRENVGEGGKGKDRREDMVVAEEGFEVGMPSNHANAIATPLGVLVFVEQHERLIKFAKSTQVFDVFKTRYNKRMTSSNRVTRITTGNCRE